MIAGQTGAAAAAAVVAGGGGGDDDVDCFDETSAKRRGRACTSGIEKRGKERFFEQM